MFAYVAFELDKKMLMATVTFDTNISRQQQERQRKKNATVKVDTTSCLTFDARTPFIKNVAQVIAIFVHLAPSISIIDAFELK